MVLTSISDHIVIGIGITKDFDNAEVKYHIAVTLFALSRKVEANKYLIEAIDSEQTFPEKKWATALLNEWSREI